MQPSSTLVKNTLLKSPTDSGDYGRLTALDVQREFMEVHNPSLQSLTEAQIQEWNTHGFILNLPLLSEEELDAARRFFGDPSKDTAALNLHARYSFAYDLVRHPRTLGYLKDLIGPDIVCFISQYINKLPGSPAANHGHQDCVFNAMNVGCAIVWLALEDADESNGSMYFVPGSHKLGVLECDESYALKDVTPYADWVPARVQAGHCVIMSDLLIHSSPANPSSTRNRPGFTATYSPSRAPLIEEFAEEPIHCCGLNAPVGWHLRPRPQTD